MGEKTSVCSAHCPGSRGAEIDGCLGGLQCPQKTLKPYSILVHLTSKAKLRNPDHILLLLGEVATNFCGYEGNLEKPGGKDWRGVTFPIHLHQLLIMKSESDNLISNVNDFTENSFNQNIQCFACRKIFSCKSYFC